MIAIHSLGKTFKTGADSVRAVDGVDLNVQEKEFFVLLGLSGSGKTTLLRCVAGLEKPEEGEIVLADQIVSSPEHGIFVPPEDRALGMVFQSYAVWPHMTVFDNVAFPLTNGKRKLARSKVHERVMGALELVQLSGLEDRPVPFLSGGQQQRVALARALAVEPKVLLMDEPLSNLDARLREEVRDEIRSLAKRLAITVLYVTHDQVEAMALADRIAVMSHGKILQIGAPQDLYDFPLSRNVGEFLGSMNEFEGTVQSDGSIQTDLGRMNCVVPEGLPREVIVVIRPEDVYLSRDPSGLTNEFPAQLISQLVLGDVTVYHLSANGKKMRGKTSRVDRQLNPGGSVYVRLPAEKLKIFPKSDVQKR
ncbi:MAG TPA: ABC transporter ATP-binding protein [Candidatus Binatia bacterium]|nr:ABC transporter ATP-binding protein [Candidatus Binatia bacterium]